MTRPDATHQVEGQSRGTSFATKQKRRPGGLVDDLTFSMSFIYKGSLRRRLDVSHRLCSRVSDTNVLGAISLQILGHAPQESKSHTACPWSNSFVNPGRLWKLKMSGVR